MSQSPYNLLGVFLVEDLPPSAVHLSDEQRDAVAECGVLHGPYLEVREPAILQMLRIAPSEELWGGFDLVESPPLTGQHVMVIKRGGRGVLSIATRDLEDEEQARETLMRAREVYGEVCTLEDVQGDVVRLTQCRPPVGFVHLERTEATIRVSAAVDEATYTEYMRRFPNGQFAGAGAKRAIAQKRRR